MRFNASPLAVALLMVSGSSLAADLSFNGFLSAGGGVVSENDTEYLGFTDDMSFDTDGVFGLQANAKIDDKLSMTAQIVARGLEDYDPKLEWAFAAYDFNEHFTARVGRLRAPFFLVSEYLEVGFAYPWIRPPQESYYFIPFSAVDGVDGTVKMPLGDWQLAAQAYFGTNKDKQFIKSIGDEVDSDVKNLTGVVLSASNDVWTLRGSYHQAEVSLDLPGLNSLLDALNGNGLTAAANDLAIDATKSKFSEVGLQYDDGQFIAIAEATRLRFDRSLLQDQDSWYTTLGWRFANGEHLLHVTYANLDTKRRDMTRYVPPIPQTAPFVAAINAAVAGQDTSQDSTTLGWRWNFSDSADLKLEWQHVNPDSDAYGLTRKGEIGQDFNVYSFVVDLVF